MFSILVWDLFISFGCGKAIVSNQSEYPRHTTLGSILGYKYKRKIDSSLFHTLQTVQVRLLRADDNVRSTTRKQQTLNILSDKIS